MSHNKVDQFKALVTRLAAADGTIAEGHAREILDAELAREVLEAIVGGQGCLGEKIRNSTTTPSSHSAGGGGLYGPWG
ncbi:MAG TPA: hypothetical protein VIH59_33975 [Candidatus Tectomicrobia bacterium]|jgi:hypothetical protein